MIRQGLFWAHAYARLIDPTDSVRIRGMAHWMQRTLGPRACRSVSGASFVSLEHGCYHAAMFLHSHEYRRMSEEHPLSLMSR